MATTFHDYNGNQGTGTNNAEYNFSFPTFKQEEVKVEVDNVVKDLTTHFTVPTYSSSTGGKIRFTTGNIPTLSTQKVRVYRQTDVDAAKATFTAGSSIKANELNTNMTLLLRSTQDRTSDKNIQTHDLNDRAVTTAKIKDGNITTAKLADSVITTTQIADGAIVNADVNASAAIDGTKIDPAFGSQNLSTSGTAATGALTVTGNITVSGTVDGRDMQTDGTKLDGIETAATADQTAAEIRTLVEAATDSNVFTDADHTKLNAIEAGATADQTAAEIKSLYESVSDTNVLTDAQVTKLSGIETGATGDQTNAEIKTAYEANANTNEFSDAEQTKLAGIETAATADQTASEIKTLLQSDKLTISEINTTSLDGRYFTETESDARYFRQDSTETIDSGDTWSSGDTHIATTGAINARILDLVDDVGGFTAITSEQHFPNTNPQGTTGQAAILSIQAASTALTPSGTTVTISNGNLANNANITITGVTATIPSGFGFLVESTSTLHTYTFHRLVPKATEVSTVANNITNIVAAGTNVVDINNFADIYQIASSAPTQRADGTSLQVGDLWFDSSNDNLTVWNGSTFATITPSQSVLDDVAIVSGAITYSEDLGLITAAATTGSSNGSLDIVADALEDEITFTVTVSSGAFLIDGVSKPALTLYKGWTYTFDLSDSSNGSHPLRFSSGGSAYNTGVTVTGTQGQAGAKVQLVVPESQPTSFAYYCTNHSGMGNTITVKDDPIKTVSDNVTNIVAVANNSTNINAVNSNSSNINSAVSNASNINSAVSNASNINSVVSNATNINTVAGAISNVNSVGTNISNVNSVHSNATNINSAVSNATNINTVAGAITNVNTVGSNISNVNNFANRYRIASSAPSSNNDAGDLYFDTSSNELRVYNGSAWQGGVTATGNLAGTGANTFSGSQTINANIIVTGTVDGRDVAADGTKLDGIEASATADQTASEIVSLISGQTIAPNVITTTNLTLDFGSIA